MAALADDIKEQFVEMAASQGSVILNTISEEDILKTDATILSIILHNLISNASKFTYKGTIEISATRNEKEYSISVNDSGSGMSKDQLNRIHEILSKQMLLSSNSSFTENGNGLGYIIIAELSELINGKLKVESLFEKGTRVTLVLNA